VQERTDRMLHALLRRFRPDPLRSRVEASIREGTGLSKHEWLLDETPISGDDLGTLSEEIVAWCRDRVATTRRPYGIDQVALAIACAVPGGPPIASNTFGVFRPVEFYEESGVADRIEEFLRAISLDELNALDEPVRFAAALFSWGDVARATVFADEPAS
jgi:hypothetical protein